MLDAADTDVVHFHNISLVGGPGRAGAGPPGRPDHDGARALADLPDAPALEVRPQALRRPRLHPLQPGGRPAAAGLAVRPGRSSRGLRQLDALVFPSRHALEEHRRRGIERPAGPPALLPPRRLVGGDRGRGRRAGRRRPYLAAAGRLVAMKGFQRLIPLMRLPARGRPADRRDRALTRPSSAPWPRDLPNVQFEGLLGGPALARLFHGARAVVVPSLFPETFGYVVLEAFAVRTPVVVHQAAGRSHETGVLSGGGLGYETDAELLLALRRIVHDDDLRDELADRGYAMRTGEWSETAHLDRYFGLIQGIRAGTGRARPPLRLGSPRTECATAYEPGRPAGPREAVVRDASGDCAPMRPRPGA